MNELLAWIADHAPPYLHIEFDRLLRDALNGAFGSPVPPRFALYEPALSGLTTDCSDIAPSRAFLAGVTRSLPTDELRIEFAQLLRDAINGCVEASDGRVRIARYEQELKRMRDDFACTPYDEP